MSATIPNISKKLLLPHSATAHNTFGNLAINTSIKRVHSHLESKASEGSSGLPPQKLIKSPNPIALLPSPPLKKGVSCNQSSHNPYMFLMNDRYVHSEKSSGLIGPLSSSSQPNRNFYDYRSPNPFGNLGKRYNNEPNSSSGTVFSEGFYRRIEDYLESEGLSLVDPRDYNRPEFKRIARSKLPCIRVGQENTSGSSEEAEMVRSACHSPKLISDSLMSSDLFQRRACHSQAPLKGLAVIGEDSPLPKRKPSRLDLKLRSPIMEKDTPRMSSRGSMWNTPATAMKGFVFFGQTQQMERTRAVSRDNSPEFKGKMNGMPSLKGAQSVHGKVNGNFF